MQSSRDLYPMQCSASGKLAVPAVGDCETGAGTNGLAIGVDTAEALSAELASFNFFAEMKYEEGVAESESKLAAILDSISAAMDKQPSPRSLKLLMDTCRTLYTLAHKHDRPVLKIVCADKLLLSEGRWNGGAASGDRGSGGNLVPATLESKDNEDIVVLEAQLARSQEAVAMLKAQCGALAAQLDAEKTRRRSCRRKYREACKTLQTELQHERQSLSRALQESAQKLGQQDCRRPHADDELSYTRFVSEREVSAG